MPMTRTIISIEARTADEEAFHRDLKRRWLVRDLLAVARDILAEENGERGTISFSVEIQAGIDGGSVIIEADTDPRQIPKLIFDNRKGGE
jgi:hypothetical protein